MVEMEDEITRLKLERKQALENIYELQKANSKSQLDIKELMQTNLTLRNEKEEIDGQLEDVRSELDRIIQAEREAMAARMSSTNITDDLASIIAARGISVNFEKGAKNLQNDLFCDKIDWDNIMSKISTNMCHNDVSVISAKLTQFKNAFDVICARMLLEAKRRTEQNEMISSVTIELANIKEELKKESRIRVALEQELIYVKQIAEEEKKYSEVAKTAAIGAIKQSKYFQDRLGKEIDMLHQHRSYTDSYSYNDYNDEGENMNRKELNSRSFLKRNNSDSIYPEVDDNVSRAFSETDYLRNKNATYPYNRPKNRLRPKSPGGIRPGSKSPGSTRSRSKSPRNNVNKKKSESSVRRRLFKGMAREKVDARERSSQHAEWVDPNHIDYRQPYPPSHEQDAYSKESPQKLNRSVSNVQLDDFLKEW
jgi:hypothetical protein